MNTFRDIPPLVLLTSVIALLGSAVVIFATRRIARDLVAAFWTPDSGLPTYRKWLDVLHRELNRARRYHHPLAVVVTRLTDSGSLGDVSRERASASRRRQLATMRAGFLMRELLRDTDVVTYDPADNRFVLLLTETDPAQARAAMARLDAIVLERAGARLRSGIAMFPADGLITEDLVMLASAHCAGEKAGTPISALAKYPAAAAAIATVKPNAARTA